MRFLGSLSLALLPLGSGLLGASASDSLREALRFDLGANGPRVQVSGLAQLQYFRGEQENPGFVFSEGKDYVLPRLTLFADADWKRVAYGFAQVDLDRGFDPGDGNTELRLDEFALRVPLPHRLANLQIGQFATVIGNWAPRHDAWQNPFLGAPLPYEYLTGIYDRSPPRYARDVAVEADEEAYYDYNPVLWGPVYATGASLTGRTRRFDWAVEIKNTGPSSRPEDWSPLSTDFSAPTLAARLGFRPDLRTQIGLSYSEGSYLAPVVRARLPSGRRLSDYRQRLWGFDASFAWHHWQVWAEYFYAEFSVPRLAPLVSQAAYVEVRYKLSPHWSIAGRANRQTFQAIHSHYGLVRWGLNLTRWDASVVWRLRSDFELKVQTSVREPSEDLPATTVYGLEAIWRF